MPGTGFAVGIVCVEAVREGLGDCLDFSVTVGGEERGPGLAFGFDRGGWVAEGVTVLPGFVTVSDEAVVVVVVVVVV